MKMDIVLGILFTILAKNEPVCAKELSSKYSISTRTVYRYIDFLDVAGIPITTKTGKSGGISVLHSFDLKKMYFSNIEILTLIQACSLVQPKQLQSSLQTKLVYLLHKHT